MTNAICTICTQEFVITEQDEAFYVKMNVPSPKRCPTCRLIRRLHERNTKNLYYRTCSFSGKKILSQYSAAAPFPVYEYELWWSDEWNPMKFGRDFDFSRPFFEQFKELKNSVPHLSLFNTIGTMENSDFNNCTAYLKNCFLISESDYAEDCYFANLLKHCRNAVDCSICYNCERVYECIDCRESYGLLYSQDCRNCRDGYFLKNCTAVTDCIGCINLRHVSFMIFNKQYTKKEYFAIKKKLRLETWSGVQELAHKAREFFLTQPQQNLMQENNENSFGDHLYNSKNALYCFDSKDLEDCTYCYKLSLGVKSCMDYSSWGDSGELVLDSSSCGDHIYNLKFCTMCLSNCSNLTYCEGCSHSNNLFGCVGLKRKSFCILNKQYTKEEYEELVPRIIQHMRKTGHYGEFFPIDLCPFAYNESIVMDYFPTTKEYAVGAGYRWKEFESAREPPTLGQLPDVLSESTQDITQELLACESCEKNYKIIPQEFSFYKELTIPLPRLCPNCRHMHRMSLRNPPILSARRCAQCGNEILTTFQPEHPKKVYCEKCFFKNAY